MSEPKLPKGYDRYGASMGRRSSHPEDNVPVGRVRLYRVRLDSGGYDNGGAYWGFGSPLWRCIGDTADDEIDYWFRASSRDEAKDIVRERYPEARFYR